jgi:hypothetical protein
MEAMPNSTTATETAELPTLAELENDLSVALQESHYSNWRSARDDIKELFNHSATLLREHPQNTTVRAFKSSTRELKNDAAQHTRDIEHIQPLLHSAHYKLDTYHTAEYEAIFNGTQEALQALRESGKESVDWAEELMKRPVYGKVRALDRYRVLKRQGGRLRRNLDSSSQTAGSSRVETTDGTHVPTARRTNVQSSRRPVAA